MKKATHYLCLMIGLLISLQSFAQHRGLFVPNGTSGTKPATSEKRIALVIANKDYQNWGDLSTPISDANLIAGKLRNAGFQTEIIYNANRSQMLTAIDALRDKVSGNETVALIYYAGHGIAHNGINYLIPTDDNSKCGGDFMYNSIALNGIQDKLKYAGAAMNILLVDACRNVFTSPITCPDGKRSGGDKGFVTYQPRGTFISFSTAPGTEALDKKPGTNNSPYAYALANALDNQGYQIEDVFKQVNRELAPVGQTPWVNNSYTGNFYFHYQKPTTNEVKDSDNDGLLDNIDKCPYEKGPVTNYGCPEATVNPAPVEPPRTSDPFADLMIRIPSGTFSMGSNEENDEKPIHSVTLSSFYMSKYEVTQKQWREVMGQDPPELAFKGCDQCPVERVSWNDIQEFIKKLNTKTGKNYRLPTEAEWEYAARGGQSYKYAGSDNIDNVAWYTSNSGSKTHPVGQKSANGYGLYDMTGNVWEWCSDWYGAYSSSSSTNPSGPSTGSYRVLRGGSWADSASYCRVATRFLNDPDSRLTSIGFRLVSQ